MVVAVAEEEASMVKCWFSFFKIFILCHCVFVVCLCCLLSCPATKLSSINCVRYMPRSLYKLPGANADCREVCTIEVYKTTKKFVLSFSHGNAKYIALRYVFIFCTNVPVPRVGKRCKIWIIWHVPMVFFVITLSKIILKSQPWHVQKGLSLLFLVIWRVKPAHNI